ncbi:MBL fold metallo-hydrolase [Saccharothrix algeriensis]|uniref:L-ascorbate metabolism protein UlaG (Beta-lactamase superfamily) n=1 Tax=Saccharothrix algeriensis TaxID=173560 RepID=A0A8T8I0D5_9PSEU|nr:MBL fold metallo-hydrolase [Saccharothrix algeriensis]MBM7809955.1 L-ascorbate metabolism protein UlaG (beta-lactamase superfamily) [Saccharothrix algeriensis]QTR04196.1 MBL fold metallo-hydrolase [Saccharothrix algeriensis]
MADSLYFVGTATTVLTLGPFTLLTDPNFLHRGQWTHIGQGLVSRRRTEPAITVADLPALDGIVLSHLHGDHFDRVASRELDRDLPIVTTAHAAKRLSRRGFRAPEALSTWQEHIFAKQGATLTVTALPGRHGPGLLNALLPPVMGSMLEYRPTAGARPLRIYLSGDTLMHNGLHEVRERFPEIDVAVLHLGGTRVLGILLTMDGEQGVDLLELLEPRHAVPVHYDDYGVMKSPLSDFVVEVRRRRPDTSVTYVYRGDTYELPTTP